MPYVSSGQTFSGAAPSGEQIAVVSGGLATNFSGTGGLYVSPEGSAQSGTITGSDIFVDSGGSISDITFRGSGSIVIEGQASHIDAAGRQVVVAGGGSVEDLSVLNSNFATGGSDPTLSAYVTDVSLTNTPGLDAYTVYDNLTMHQTNGGSSLLDVLSSVMEGSISLGGTSDFGASILRLDQTSQAAGTHTTIYKGGHEILLMDSIVSNVDVYSGGELENIVGGIDGAVVHSGGLIVISGYGDLTPNNSNIDIEQGGKIEFSSYGDTSLDTVSFDSATNTLTVFDQYHNPTSLKLSGDYAGDYFLLSEDAATHNVIVTVSDVACYCRGTLIRTNEGEKPVEALAIGDRLVTRSGETKPVKWIGRRSYSRRFAMGQKHVLPVCIKAGAIDDHVPARDLWISPHHAMYFDGALVEAKDLVNGTTVFQSNRFETIDYFHIELEEHDVIFAEGAMSETFIDDASRSIFHNAQDYARLYPDETSSSPRYCAPRLSDGEQLETIREGLAKRSRIINRRAG